MSSKACLHHVQTFVSSHACADTNEPSPRTALCSKDPTHGGTLQMRSPHRSLRIRSRIPDLVSYRLHTPSPFERQILGAHITTSFKTRRVRANGRSLRKDLPGRISMLLSRNSAPTKLVLLMATPLQRAVFPVPGAQTLFSWDRTPITFPHSHPFSLNQPGGPLKLSHLLTYGQGELRAI